MLSAGTSTETRTSEKTRRKKFRLQGLLISRVFYGPTSHIQHSDQGEANRKLKHKWYKKKRQKGEMLDGSQNYKKEKLDLKSKLLI